MKEKERELENLTLFSNRQDSQSMPSPLPQRSPKKGKARRRGLAADVLDAIGKIGTIEQNRQKMKSLREEIENLKKKGPILFERSVEIEKKIVNSYKEMGHRGCDIP